MTPVKLPELFKIWWETHAGVIDGKTEKNIILKIVFWLYSCSVEYIFQWLLLLNWKTAANLTNTMTWVSTTGDSIYTVRNTEIHFLAHKDQLLDSGLWSKFTFSLNWNHSKSQGENMHFYSKEHFKTWEAILFNSCTLQSLILNLNMERSWETPGWVMFARCS